MLLFSKTTISHILKNHTVILQQKHLALKLPMFKITDLSISTQLLG